MKQPKQGPQKGPANLNGTKDQNLPIQDLLIPDEVALILKDLPEAQQQAVRAVLIGVSYQRLWQGALPPPDLLKEYNETFPEAAEKIFTELQRQTAHRLEMEKGVMHEQIKQSNRGQVYGLIVALSFLVAAFVLIALGHGMYGTIIGSIDLVALVTVFVIGRREENRWLQLLEQ